MANSQKRFRVPRIHTPWEPVTPRNEEVIYTAIGDEIRRLERDKVGDRDLSLSGAVSGDLLVANSAAVFRPGKVLTASYTVSGGWHIGGVLQVDTSGSVAGAFAVGGVLSVTGAAAITGALSVGGTAGVTGAVSLGSTLAVTGAATITGAVGVGGALNVTGAVNATGTAMFNTGVTIKTGALGTVGLIVSGAASQSASLQEWRNAAGTAVASIDSAGRLGLGTSGNGALVDLAPNESGTGFRFGVRMVGSIISSNLYAYSIWMNPILQAVNGGFTTALYAGAQVQVDSGQTVTAYGGYIAPMTQLGAGTVTTAYSLLIQPPGLGTVANYTLYVADGTNYIGGATTVVSSNPPMIPLIVRGAASQSADLQEWRDSSDNVNAYVSNIAAACYKPRDGATTTSTAALTLGHNSSGAAGSGFGVGVSFLLQSSLFVDQAAAAIRVGWATATHASRAASGAIDAYYTTTARECFCWAADSSVARVGFLGAAHQPRTSAYTPTNVSTDRSYDANATTLDEVADVLGTLIADLQGFGFLG